MAQSSNTNASAKTSASDVDEQLRALQGDLKALTESVAALAAERTGEMKENLRERINDTASEARQRASEAHNRVNGVIEENPMTSVLVAFGTGIALGLLSRR